MTENFEARKEGELRDFREEVKRIFKSPKIRNAEAGTFVDGESLGEYEMHFWNETKRIIKSGDAEIISKEGRAILDDARSKLGRREMDNDFSCFYSVVINKLAAAITWAEQFKNGKSSQEEYSSDIREIQEEVFG